MKRLKEIIYYIFIIYFYSTVKAYSYIDISIIAVFFQLIFAGIVAALLTIKLWFKKLKNFVKSLINKKTKN